jgi:hypothetical protein
MNDYTLHRPSTAWLSGPGFAAAALTLAISALVLAGWAPIAFSMTTVFLFAGPHNWFEVRYFLARLPARWGKLRGYFLTAVAGILGLTAAFALLPHLFARGGWSGQAQFRAYALWDSALTTWVAVLVHMRSKRNPRRNWSWTFPAALTLGTLSWIEPYAWSLALVYLHPVIALWILDRELRRSRPRWRQAYHACLACLPILLGLLCWQLAGSAPLVDTDAMTFRITRHAGAEILPRLSSHLLVSTHTFLEMLHYSVWLVAVPLVGLPTAAWRVRTVPLARRSLRWQCVVVGVLACGGLLVLVLWTCFALNYGVTRDIYFTLAMLHVLAEVPFLLRAL